MKKIVLKVFNDDEKKFHDLSFAINSSLDERVPPPHKIHKEEDEQTVKLLRQITEMELQIYRATAGEPE